MAQFRENSWRERICVFFSYTAKHGERTKQAVSMMMRDQMTERVKFSAKKMPRALCSAEVEIFSLTIYDFEHPPFRFLQSEQSRSNGECQPLHRW